MSQHDLSILREPYDFPLERFISQQRFERIKDFSREKETPFVVIDLDIVRRKYLELKDQIPFAKIFYAVKANPMDEIITLLNELGSSFDVASRFELDQLLRLGVSPERMSFGNTIKKRRDIAYFYEKGVRLFVSDSNEDLRNIAAAAPGVKVFFRLLNEGSGSDWPLSRKFGTHADTAYHLVLEARDLGLVPYGVSFHVGSQQRDVGQWDDSIAHCRYLFDAAREQGINLRMINIGGGLPANYLDPNLPTEVYTSEIKRFLLEDFGDQLPEIFVEPGRSLTGDAGILVAEVILVTKKTRNSLYPWVYLDIGMFGGLIETMGEAIKYPIYFDKDGDAEEIILAGPTCDSMDILYEQHRYRMPDTVGPGDRVYIFTTGAYTQSYSSIAFNGFPPLKGYVIRSE